jgi:SAM-dependent methyltransferase
MPERVNRWGYNRGVLEPETYREQFELEDEHWWFKGRRAVIWSLLRPLEASGALRVLDAGCGTGRNLIEFRRLGPVSGVDTSPEALAFCRERGIEDVRPGSLEALPFEDGSFDLILATDVIEHLRDDAAALLELRRVSDPAAHLLLTVPAYRWLWSEHDDAHHHFRRYTLRELRRRAQAAGWRPVGWSYFNTTLLPAVAAVRLASRLRTNRTAEAPRSDVKPTPAPINRLLEAPLRLEARLIAQGAHLPAGVSIGMLCSVASNGP